MSFVVPFAILASAGCSVPLPTLIEILHVLIGDGLPAPQIVLNHPFAERDGLTLKMDVFLPDVTNGETLRPAVILVHGGSWLFGTRRELHDWAADLAKQGYVAASIDYRLLEDGGQFPAPVADLLAAIANIREHADEWNVDANRIALFGASAGACLALLAGMADDVSVFDSVLPIGESARIRAIVDLYGPTDFLIDAHSAQDWQEVLVTTFLGVKQMDGAERWQAASPITYARVDGPPVLILHGTADDIVPFSQAEALRDALQTAGQPFTFIPVDGAGHSWGSEWPHPEVQRHRAEILGFLAASLQ